MDVVRVMVVFCIQTSGCGGGEICRTSGGEARGRTPGSCALIGGFSKSRKAAQRTRDQGQDSGERERSKFQGLRRSSRNGLRSYVILSTTSIMPVRSKIGALPPVTTLRLYLSH